MLVPKSVVIWAVHEEYVTIVSVIGVCRAQTIRKKYGFSNIGILITDHDVQATLAITDKTYLMYNGSILKEGTPEELAADEMVRKVYLGQDFELKKKKIFIN